MAVAVAVAMAPVDVAHVARLDRGGRGLHADFGGHDLGESGCLSADSLQIAGDGVVCCALVIALDDKLPLNVNDQLGCWAFDVGRDRRRSGGWSRGRSRRGSSGGRGGSGSVFRAESHRGRQIGAGRRRGYRRGCGLGGGCNGGRRGRGGRGRWGGRAGWRSRSVGVLDGEGVFRPMLNLDTTRETVMGIDILVLQLIRHLKLAFALVVLGLEVENRAILDLSAWVRALVDSLLQDTRFPALHEVAVVAKSSGVAVCQNELAIIVLEVLGVPDGLVEEGDKTMLVALGTGSVHDEGGIGDMGHVVLRVDILAIPAGGEHNLKAQTIRAEEVQKGLLRQIVTVQ